MNNAQLEVLFEIDEQQWNDDVIKLNGNCFHSFKWSQYSAENNQAKPLFFKLLDSQGKLTAMGFGLIIEKKVAGISIYRKLTFGNLPASIDDDNLKHFLKAVLEFSTKNKITELRIYSYATPFGSDFIREIGLQTSRRWEFLVDINKTEEDLWNNIHGKKRNLIRKGIKSGLRIEKAIDIQEVLQFRKLAVDTFRRKIEQGIDYPEPGSDSYYKLLKTKLIDTGLGYLYLAYYNDEPVAGAFFVSFNNSVYYMLSAANMNGFKTAAPDLILWTCMTDFLKEGCTSFNLGGLSESELNNQPLEKSGLYHFKKRFSADPVECLKGSIVLKPGMLKIFNVLKKIKTAF